MSIRFTKGRGLFGEVKAKSVVTDTLSVAGRSFAGIVSGTVSVNPPSITASGGVATVDVAIPSAAAGDLVVMIPPTDLEAGLCVVSSKAKAGGVDLVLMNATADAVNGAAKDWDYKIIKV